ncbi:MAG TPA: copper homeostasis periplasmic binding protein CopC [Aliidongia sp.]|nr:copper homeostasis periplasmic binding protein CopC [Aliidongia sp.]
MIKRSHAAAFAAGLLLAVSGHAFAHAMLETAAPAAGSTVAAPAEIRLAFTEALEPHFSSITLSAPDGKPVAAPKAAPDPADAKVLILHPEAPLAPGRYHVVWTVVSVDTHRTQGAFDFTVQP